MIQEQAERERREKQEKKVIRQNPSKNQTKEYQEQLPILQQFPKNIPHIQPVLRQQEEKRPDEHTPAFLPPLLPSSLLEPEPANTRSNVSHQAIVGTQEKYFSSQGKRRKPSGKHHKTSSQQTGTLLSQSPTPAFLASTRPSATYLFPKHKEASAWKSCYFFVRELMGLLEPTFFALVGTPTGVNFVLGNDIVTLCFFTVIGLYVGLSAFAQADHLLEEQRLLEGFLLSLMIFFVGAAVILTWLDKTVGITLYLTNHFLLGPAAFIVSLSCAIIATMGSLIKHSYEYYRGDPTFQREHLQKILLNGAKLLFYGCAIATLLFLFSPAAPAVTLLITILASTSAGLCALERLYRFFIYREEYPERCRFFSVKPTPKRQNQSQDVQENNASREKEDTINLTNIFCCFGGV